MSLVEVLPSLRQLDRADKFKAMQFLMLELAQEEQVPLLPAGEYAIWSPYAAYAAADVLYEALTTTNKTRLMQECAKLNSIVERSFANEGLKDVTSN